VRVAARRSFWAWGLESDEPTPEQRREMAQRLSQQYGVALEAPPSPTDADLALRRPRLKPPRSLAPLCSTDTHDRTVHSYGRGFQDRVRAFNRQFLNPPDVVAHPRN
jgi:alkyldihydroxyacetonephosphate synthase